MHSGFCLLKECEDDYMPHYFSEDNDTLKSNPKEIAFRVHNTDFLCVTDIGVFAKDQLDRGTKVLLQYVQVADTVQSVLDLGCGYGAIGLVIGKLYQKDVDMVDVNKRAITLAKTNVLKNGIQAHVFYSDGFQEITQSYDLIVSNPPIRVGKKKLYALLEGAWHHLRDDGSFVFVINKKHGAESAINYVKKKYSSVEILGRKKGFLVITCKK